MNCVRYRELCVITGSRGLCVNVEATFSHSNTNGTCPTSNSVTELKFSHAKLIYILHPDRIQLYRILGVGVPLHSCSTSLPAQSHDVAVIFQQCSQPMGIENWQQRLFSARRYTQACTCHFIDYRAVSSLQTYHQSLKNIICFMSEINMGSVPIALLLIDCHGENYVEKTTHLNRSLLIKL